jgi:CRISPR-associated protein Cas2
MFVLIAYDIESDRTRRRVAETLEGYGQRVQRSVFECDLTHSQYEELRAQFDTLHGGTSTDSIRCYRLCANCVDKVRLIGEGELRQTASCQVV